MEIEEGELGWIGRICTSEETMMPRSLGTLRPWRRIQYRFLKMRGGGESALEPSICPNRTRSSLNK
jgi:hypothetical protein